MPKTKPVIAVVPLENGQIWRMADADLRVGMVGKLLVHYKLGKANAPRISNSCSSIASVEKFLAKNHAVLVKQDTPVPA